jgi:hypothetical protein
MMWRHVVISTRRTWLHGDPRGFRSRRHRIHSSGDYKNPPPRGEHELLLRHASKRSKGTAIKIPKHLRIQVGLALLRAVLESGGRVLVIAVKGKHAHLLTEVPRALNVVKQLVGKWKAARTRALWRAMPGSIWGDGGKYKRVRSKPCLRAAFQYIRDEQGPGAWVWTYREGVPTEVLKDLEKRLREKKREGQRKSAPSPKPGAQRSGAPDRRAKTS